MTISERGGGQIWGIPLVLATTIVALACGWSTSSSVTSIAVSGNAPAVGATSQFTAVATMSDGTQEDVTSTATWSTSDAGEATVSEAGLVTGVAAGPVTVRAAYSSVTGSEVVTVSP